ncbi:MAG: ABC transporter ATP-binding protein [Eubacteriales bacterium]|jgi:oligopeptide transport system ATP-binding protein|nr:ABC transporter ATP-binding protein [Clostridiales bacterium]MDD7397055.1 ABC transporter ATP-binding protein [Eubacteriales bacterium]MDY2982358.1 ABC transporter ATP-binding protein [Eubacteriales bacterium]
MSEYLIEARNLCKYFPVDRKRQLKAVDGVNIAIRRGETLGLVGESGCGKTTCGRTLLRLYAPTAGQIFFDGRDIAGLKGRELLDFKHRAQIVFQDPYSSLDPRMTIGEIIAEGMDVHLHLSHQEKERRIKELLLSVGLTEQFTSRFAHELSGGQRQRVGIARALAVDPEFIVCDEPISALDVSIQAQIINLLIRLQRERGLTYLFISHDLSMVRHISDRVGVMYLGSMVELAPSKTLFTAPLHPYTKALMAAVPKVDFDRRQKPQRLQGEVPSPIDPPPGCRFAARCPLARDICRREMPPLQEAAPDHFVACHLCGREGEV